MNNDKKTVQTEAERHENRDPITGTPGAHPVGTGIGAAGGAAAGAAIGTAVGGPIGAGIGIVAGAVVGGLAGKGAAEAVDPTAEDAYWRENYRTREYVSPQDKYETYRPAYRVGYEGYGRYQGQRYEEAEPALRSEYEQAAGTSALEWEKARRAARDAWERVDQSRKTKATPGSGGCGCA